LQSANPTSPRRRSRKKTSLEKTNPHQLKKKNAAKKTTKVLLANAPKALVALLKVMVTEMKSVGRLWSMLVFSSLQSTKLMESRCFTTVSPLL
jgi:hypothetical protein